MSATTLTEPAETTPPAYGGTSLRPPAERGELTVADQVVEKIAAAVLAEVEGVGGSARRVLGVALGSDAPEGSARVSAHVDGSLVTLDVACSITYPDPVRTVSERARIRLIERVGALTGLGVRQVDITVTALTTPSTPSGRRLL